MNITEIYGLPFVSMTVMFRGRELNLKKVLLDTGSASTLLTRTSYRRLVWFMKKMISLILYGV